MSAKSDLHEHAVAKNIDGTIKGLSAERPKVATSFPDVRVDYKTFTGSKAVWVEVKMNHTDNLMNPRFSYINGKWQVRSEEHTSESSHIPLSRMPSSA